jgi:hypothetical protein
MTERQVLVEYVLTITSRRGVAEALLPTLFQILSVKRVRMKWPSLTQEEVEKVARGLVREEEPRTARRRVRGK